MFYSIEVSYPDALHLPTNSKNPHLAIVSGLSMRLRKMPLVEAINAVFDGNHDRVFGTNKHIEPNDPEYILLSIHKWQ